MMSRPAVPEARSASSRSAESSRSKTASACLSSSRPAGVSVTGFGPPGRSKSEHPDRPLESRDLLADGGLREAEDVGRPDEGALLGHGPQGGQVSDLHIVRMA